ncbi:hypothetical protein CLOM_g10843 [Closterium sp. NIES-68]|nr:hypothetical protein CLOM_g10843 [Closterium sp. NIES-68]
MAKRMATVNNGGRAGDGCMRNDGAAGWVCYHPRALDADDRNAIDSYHVALRNGLVGGGENCSTWGGVVCDDDGYVTQLDLSGLDLEGTIPSDAISTLVTLQELKLHDNSIEDDLPVKFSALTALSFLSLGRNDIAGFIPPGYSALSKLTTFS